MQMVAYVFCHYSVSVPLNYKMIRHLLFRGLSPASSGSVSPLCMLPFGRCPLGSGLEGLLCTEYLWLSFDPASLESSNSVVL